MVLVRVCCCFIRSAEIKSSRPPGSDDTDVSLFACCDVVTDDTAEEGRPFTGAAEEPRPEPGPAPKAFNAPSVTSNGEGSSPSTAARLGDFAAESAR